MSGMRFLYILPTAERHRRVARQDYFPRIFVTKELALEYARRIARQSGSSAIVERTGEGKAIARETFG